MEIIFCHERYISSMSLQEIGTLRDHFIAFDVETTGLNPDRDRIIEISAVRFRNGKPIDKYTSLVSSTVPISRSAQQTNHITKKMLENAPDEDQTMHFLKYWMPDAFSGDTCLVAHNARFDMQFLSQALLRCGMTANIEFYDTCYAARQLVVGQVNNKLSTLAAFFGIPIKEAHRAEADAEMCGSLLLCLLNLREPTAATEYEEYKEWKIQKDQYDKWRETVKDLEDRRLLSKTVKSLFEMEKITLSSLEQRAQIGHTTAKRMMNKAEEMGVVYPREGNKPWVVAISPEQWELACPPELRDIPDDPPEPMFSKEAQETKEEAKLSAEETRSQGKKSFRMLLLPIAFVILDIILPIVCWGIIGDGNMRSLIKTIVVMIVITVVAVFIYKANRQ